MNQRRSISFAAGILSILSSTCAFGNQDGTTTATFLRIGQGARAEAMGGAFTAVADDAYAVYWNPAGLAQITRRSAAVNHVEFIEKISSQFASFVQPVNKLNGSLGVGLTYIDLGKIDKTDATNADLGTGKVSSYAGTLSWGQAFGEKVGLGVSFKLINQDLAGESASGFAADLGGLLVLVPDRLSLGGSVLNLGPQIKTGTTDEDLPRTVSAGLAYRAIPRRLLIAVDAAKEAAADVKLRIGGEYTIQDRYILRAGFQDNQEAGGGLSAGLGYVWRPRGDNTTDFFGQYDSKKESLQQGLDVRIDYAYVDLGDFDSTHRIGIHLAF